MSDGTGAVASHYSQHKYSLWKVDSLTIQSGMQVPFEAVAYNRQETEGRGAGKAL